MKKSRMFMLASLVACSSATWAGVAPNEGPPAGGGGAVDAALKTCASSVAKDARGGPDQTAMTACMTKAGFTKPEGGGKHHGPPPGNPPERK